jgi:glycosyltransferase involved in cell wall biosynthesis
MAPKNNKKKNKNSSGLPNVSICTPTYNRRPFFEGLIQCVINQDYPHYKMEWIIVDDGTDKIEDIFTDEKVLNSLGDIKVRYFYVSEHMNLGKKRNFMHEKCTFKNDDDIVVYMDDDDYYPSQRVSHSVKKLCSNKNVLCGGSSELYLWFNTLDKMYRFGPYGPNHATAGTFAFKRKLLNHTSYDDEAILAEEKHFLKDYTIPFIQFDPFKTILVVSHEQNTFDKKKLLNQNNNTVNKSAIKVKQFISDETLRHFYEKKINELLKDYNPGDISNKPKVLEEIARREEERRKKMELMQMEQNNRGSGISANINGETRELKIEEVKNILLKYQTEIEFYKNKTKELIEENKNLLLKLRFKEEELNQEETKQEEKN